MDKNYDWDTDIEDTDVDDWDYKPKKRNTIPQPVNLPKGNKQPQVKLKNSTLSIIAVVFSFFPILSIVAVILALIDLIKKRDEDIPHKHVLSYGALAICALNYIIVVGSVSSYKSTRTSKATSGSDISQTQNQVIESGVESQEQVQQIEQNEPIEPIEQNEPIEQEELESIQEPTQSIEENNENQGNVSETAEISDNPVEILKEYTLQSEDSWSNPYRFLIIHNTGLQTVDVSTSSLAYDGNGNIISANNESFDALGPDCTSIIREYFETQEKIDHYETTIKASTSQYYKSVIQDLSYVQNDIAEGAVFQVTNNGEYAAEYVEGYALFFKEGNIVDYNSTFFTDDDYEIKPSDTISKQISSYEEFDSIEFYLTGRRYK